MTSCTIKNLRFFKGLGAIQLDPNLGCIPASVYAVLAYQGEPHILNERMILAALSLKDLVGSISFEVVGRYVLKPDLTFCKKFSLKIFRNTDFEKWKQICVAQVQKDRPPIVAYVTDRVRFHANVLLGIHDANTGWFLLYDPGRGIMKERMNRLRPILQPEILSIGKT